MARFILIGLDVEPEPDTALVIPVPLLRHRDDDPRFGLFLLARLFGKSGTFQLLISRPVSPNGDDVEGVGADLHCALDVLHPRLTSIGGLP